MQIIEKPSKTRLVSAATDYFAHNPNAVVVGIRTKEGREFWFRRDPYGGPAHRISRTEAEGI